MRNAERFWQAQKNQPAMIEHDGDYSKVPPRVQPQQKQTTNTMPKVTTNVQTPRMTGGGGGGGGVASAPVSNPNQPYMDQLNNLYNQIMGRDPFRYDLNGDLLYRQYADQYSQLGRQAMRDATGTAAGLTGGYGNSYANQVGNQAYQQYLTQLNSMIPEFYDRAYNAWLNEGDQLLQQYQMAAAHPGYLASLTPAPVSGGGGGGGKKQTEDDDEELKKAANLEVVTNPLTASAVGAAAGVVGYGAGLPWQDVPFAGYYQAVLDEMEKNKK